MSGYACGYPHLLFPARLHAAAGDVAVGSQVIHEGAREKLVFFTKQQAFFLHDPSRKFPSDVDGVPLNADRGRLGIHPVVLRGGRVDHDCFMVAMVLMIVNEPLPRPTQPSQALFVFSIVAPRLNRLPRCPCLLFVSGLQLQKAGPDVCCGYRQKGLPEKLIDGWSRVRFPVPAIPCRPPLPGIPQSLPHARDSVGLRQRQPAIRGAGPVRVLFMEELREDGVVWSGRLRRWCRRVQLGNGFDQGQETRKVRLDLLEPPNVPLSFLENRLQQVFLSLSEGWQEVMCEMPRCEVRHKGGQVLRQLLGEGRGSPPALQESFG